MRWFSKIKRFLNGDELDELVETARKSTQETCDRIDKLLERAQMNHESEWMILGKPNKHKEGHI